MRGWAFAPIPAPAWSCRELRSVNYTSEFVPTGGKGAGLSCHHTVSHWLRAVPRDANSPAFSALCLFCQSAPWSPKAVLWTKSEVWTIRSKAYRSQEGGLREIAKETWVDLGTWQSLGGVHYAGLHVPPTQHCCTTAQSLLHLAIINDSLNSPSSLSTSKSQWVGTIHLSMLALFFFFYKSNISDRLI